MQELTSLSNPIKIDFLEIIDRVDLKNLSKELNISSRLTPVLILEPYEVRLGNQPRLFLLENLEIYKKAKWISQLRTVSSKTNGQILIWI